MKIVLLVIWEHLLMGSSWKHLKDYFYLKNIFQLIVQFLKCLLDNRMQDSWIEMKVITYVMI